MTLRRARYEPFSALSLRFTAHRHLIRFICSKQNKSRRLQLNEPNEITKKPTKRAEKAETKGMRRQNEQNSTPSMAGQTAEGKARAWNRHSARERMRSEASSTVVSL